jgi:hypothetical protein
MRRRREAKPSSKAERDSVESDASNIAKRARRWCASALLAALGGLLLALASSVMGAASPVLPESECERHIDRFSLHRPINCFGERGVTGTTGPIENGGNDESGVTGATGATGVTSPSRCVIDKIVFEKCHEYEVRGATGATGR